MKRADIFSAIVAERDAQDKVWADRTQYSRSAPHIIILQGQMRKLEDEWYSSKRDALLDRFKKIAAIAVRALEEIDPVS